MGQKVSKHQVVQNIDWKKYLGKWYELGRYPVVFEEGCKNVTAEYQLDPNKPNEIKVINTCPNLNKTSVGRAVVKYPGESIGQLEVSFFPLIWGDYNIMALLRGNGPSKPMSIPSSHQQQYQMSIVVGELEGDGRYKTLWILSRTPKINPVQEIWLNIQLDRLQVDRNKIIWN